MFFFFIFLLTLIGLQHLSQFVCHATTLHSAPHNLPIVGSAPPSPSSSSSSSSSMQIESLHVNCTRDLFHMHLELNRPFHGLLYAKDFPLECLTRGKDSMQLHLRLPTSGCGVRAEFSPDNGGIMEYSVRIMLQMEQKLRQSTDIWRTVKCHVPVHEMGMSLPSLKEDQPMLPKERNPRMHNFAAVASSATVHHHPHHHHQAHMDSPRIRIWLELGGPNGSGSVEVGMPTTLTVRAIVPGTIGVHVVDCSALDGLGESMQQLLDSRGCPIDEQVMPALHTRFKPAEEGWSKQHEEDLVERIFSATFPAFKFPDRERLHVSCGVQLCKGKCPNPNCQLNKEMPLQVNLDQHLARIEVFNSLAVTAPQIEVDRLRYDRGYNISEDYPPYVRPLPSEGTLCLSISKLAISFCILGLIFLVAVIVAILSLIRTRRRQQHCGHGGHGGVSSSMGLGLGTSTNSSSRLHRDRAEICTSMFSSSSGDSGQSANVAGGSRFGGKFLMPYYPHNLPYGRVY
ncbi:uncharacterized protein cyr isoform X2 [Drosophila tropicalis]|uniref:uncharacterized protein cyr isoform X2 n=1 Tax=Drosophila tropicalis TaxID=46794 RepID=UPI0035ABB324